MADDLKRAVVWKSLLIVGTDDCGLWHTAEGWLLKGTVIGPLKDQRPMLASCEIHCDKNKPVATHQNRVTLHPASV
jgi:hypothetical protein